MFRFSSKVKPPYNNRKEHAKWKKKFAFFPVVISRTGTTETKVLFCFYEERVYCDPMGASVYGGDTVTERRLPGSTEVCEVDRHDGDPLL